MSFSHFLVLPPPRHYLYYTYLLIHTLGAYSIFVGIVRVVGISQPRNEYESSTNELRMKTMPFLKIVVSIIILVTKIFRQGTASSVEFRFVKRKQ